MKKALAILGALLVVALGFLMPHIAAAVQDRGLEGDVWEKENAAVSLTLAQEIVDLPELDLLERLDLFSLVSSTVKLEEGRNTTAIQAARASTELGVFLAADVFDEELFDDDSNMLPDDVTPYLLSDKYGRSGIYWRCSWEAFPGESVWVDDQSRKIVGFCLRCPDIDLSMDDFSIASLCEFICTWLYNAENLYKIQSLVASEDTQMTALTRGLDSAFITLHKTDEYLCFNISPAMFDV